LEKNAITELHSQTEGVKSMLKETKRAGKTNAVIPGMLLLLIAFIIVTGCLVPDISAAAGRDNAARKFAEVEIGLNDQVGVADISALPRAPGSVFAVLDNPRRVRVQLPAGRAKALADEGADVTTLRQFILVESFADQAIGPGGDTGILASCSGPFEHDFNNTNISIPDYPGYGDPHWVYSDIEISGAPADAVANCVDVSWSIYHNWPADLYVSVSDYDLTYEHALWEWYLVPAGYIGETVTGITDFYGEPVNQIWTLWASDWGQWDTGYIDSWWIKVYYQETPPPVNDECSNAIGVTDGAPYSGSTVSATGTYWTGCSYNDTKDVWHWYTATGTGLVTISLAGSTFDTTLAVFDECDGAELACNDDSCGGSYQSEIAMVMTAARTYFIRVAGYYGAVGDYTLTVTGSPCVLPPEPNHPSPANDVNLVAHDIVLSWNGAKAYEGGSKKTGASSLKDILTPKVIYGDDDRLEHYQVTDAAILAVGDSTVALVSKPDLVDNGNGTFSLPTQTYAEWYQLVDPLATGNPLCPDEPFRDQPKPAWGTGFLVAPDIVATAGHLACPQDCADVAFVFGFVMLDASTPVLTIDASEVYYCSEVIARQTGMPDWALVRLDRQVTGHSPLRVRTGGVIPDGEALVAIGHPVGLPRKYAANANVRDNNEAAYFEANLDTFGGNSGSPVFNADTLEVEGLVFGGNPDWMQDGSCDRSNVCPDTGCPGWEYVARTTEFAPLLPQQTYDVYFEGNEPPTELVCSDTEAPMCDPTPEVGKKLKPCTRYYWKVVARNYCGQTEGPVWSFTTASVPGDFDNNCAVDFKDMERLVLYWLENEPSVNIAPPESIIDFSDFAVLAAYWLWSQEP